MKYTFLTIIIFLNSLTLFAQNLTAKLIDQNTKSPILFASIKTGEFSGVISNEEGYFTIIDASKDTALTISCLGYKSKTLNMREVRSLNFIIPLEESISELNTVYIVNKRPNADSIISRARQHISSNYENNYYKHKVFSRETAYVDFKDLNFEVEKSSHVKKKDLESANKSLDSLANAIINSKTMHFKDFKADLYVADSSRTKLMVQKATELLDQKNDLSIDEVQNRAQHVILKYLDTTLTYKLKSGLFKIEDSLSLKNEGLKDSINNEYTVRNLRDQTNELLKRSKFYDESMLSKLLDADLYDYSLLDISNFNDELIYVIGYKPRRSRAKYTGKLYIIDDSYAITKVDFEFADGKRGEKLNLRLLFGVKYVENVRKGTVIFQKDALAKYHPRYLKYEEGRYFYVSRPLKFIENSPAKNKTSFDFKIEGNIITKQELLLISNTKISSTAFDEITEAKKVPYTKLNKYDATIWQNEETIEPLNEMKQFKSTENELQN